MTIEIQKGPLFVHGHSRVTKERGDWNAGGWLHVDWNGRRMLDWSAQLVVSRRVRFGMLLSYGTGDGNRGVSVMLQLLWLVMYFTLDNIVPERFLPKHPDMRYPCEREIGIRIFNGSIWLSLWNDPHETRSSKPWTDPRSGKRSPALHVVDWIFGREEIQSDILSETLSTQIVMPEAMYAATVVLVRRTWQRPRWPWGRIVELQADVEIPRGIPIPGKGENGWDFEDDAVYGVTVPAETFVEAVQAVGDGAMRERMRLGSADWRPKE